MDNVNFHKSGKTKYIIVNAQCELIFLPPYFPDLNQIENFWANFKENVKKVIDRFSTLADTVDAAFRQDHLNLKWL